MAKLTNKQIKLKDNTNRSIQKNRYKGCIWELNSNIENDCSPDIIAAHSIQRGKIFSNIADNGKIYRLGIDYSSNTQAVSIQFEGISKFSTFKGCCGKHDKAVFQAIEDKPFEATPLQMDLYAYRAASKILAENLTSAKIYNNKIKNRKSNLINDYDNANLNIEDFKNICFNLQDAIEIQKHRYYKHIHYSFDKEYPIACSSSFPLYYDLDGKELFSEKEKKEFIQAPNSPNSNTRSKLMVILNIFPEQDRTHIIFSISNSNKKLKCILKELFKTNESNIKQQLSNLIINYVENVAFKPSYIHNFFTEIEKNKICIDFNTNNINDNSPVTNSICLFREQHCLFYNH